jgi:tRNA pseudouridine32 synthase/23S rRNA pseudouridine746 synthase
MNSNSPLELIYQDDHLLVANKPPGLLSVPGCGADKQDCLSSRLQQEFPDALIVHRLDMSTSGLMLFARGAEMQRCISLIFQEREVEKRYVAVVAGRLEPERKQSTPSLALPQRERGRSLLFPLGEGREGGWGEVNLPIAADWPNRPLQRIDALLGKPSLTRYRVLGFDADNTCVELEPVTGRTHQLRVHMKAIGHPILGDALYGDVDSAPRLKLHATMLKLLHPVTRAPLHFVSAPPF